jgi:hypothetical protein
MFACTEISRLGMKYRTLVFAMIAYCLASLLHFTHNGVFLAEYPNLPSTITVTMIFGVWLAITSVGAVGWTLVRTGRIFPGLLLIGVYACFGFDGFAHYTVASMASHSLTMNATIWLEAMTAAFLLCVVATEIFSYRWEPT